MKVLLRNIVAHTYKPALEKYLSRTRIYKYEDIKLEIPPQVFHPGFFFSTRFILDHIKTHPLRGKQFLEIGAGSGLISFIAAKKGSFVTATDINPVAVDYLKKNALKNGVSVSALQSDLFTQIPSQQFDLIAINPPFYKKDPADIKDYSWYCGSNGEYFENLFRDLGKYIHPNTKIFMVLFEGCDINMIWCYAARNGFHLVCVNQRKNWLETLFIYKINFQV